MKWFGTKAAALEAGRPVLARAWGSGAVALGEWPASYEAQLRAGVIGNPVAQRAMRLVSEGAGACALKVGGVDGEAAARIGALVARASAGQGLIETLASHVLLHGNGYVQVIAGADGMPAELFALRPERVSVEADARGWPAAYLYRVGESVTRLSPEDGAGRTSLLHIRALHPLDDHYGLGCVGAAAGAVAIHNAATVWNKALLDNAARPSGALVYSAGGGTLTEEQFRRLKEELEENFSGAANAGRPMVLDGGIDWKAIAMSPREMDFIEARHAAARDIALAFGVPPMLLGIPGDNTYANLAEANRALWRQTLVPLVVRVSQELSLWLGPAFEGAEVVPDFDEVEALAEDRAALWARVAGADFLSDAEKREMVGVGT